MHSKSRLRSLIFGPKLESGECCTRNQAHALLSHIATVLMNITALPAQAQTQTHTVIRNFTNALPSLRQCPNRGRHLKGARSASSLQHIGLARLTELA